MKLQEICVCLSITSVICFSALTNLCVADFSCPPGWIFSKVKKNRYQISERCLKAVTSPKSFDNARKECWDNGGQLMAKWEGQIFQYILDNKMIDQDAYWIGIRYNKAQNFAEFLNDFEQTVTQTDEDRYLCMSYHKRKRQVFLPCSEELPFLCEARPECDSKTYGAKCSKRCSPYCGGEDKACNNMNGSCVYGCVYGYEGELCDRAECGKNSYGAKCSNNCSPYCGGRDKVCNNINGSCIGGCVDGYQGELCDRKCDNKTYGVKCSKRCSPYCGGEDKACNNMNGSCVYGCVDGYQEELCDRECSNKTYGVKCSKGCSQHCGGKDKACNNINGSCVYGCVDGFEGELCDSKKPNETQRVVNRHKKFIYSHAAIISSIAFALAVLIAFLLLPKVRSAEERLSRYTSSMEQEDQF